MTTETKKETKKEVKKNTIARLQDMRVELQEMKLKKSGENAYAGYSYFELSDFIPTVNTLLKKYGMASVIRYGLEMATLTIEDSDVKDGDDTVVFTCPMSSAKLKGCHEVQNLGAVLTYIRRYLWITALEIVEQDPLEATTGKIKPEETKQKETNKYDLVKKTIGSARTKEVLEAIKGKIENLDGLSVNEKQDLKEITELKIETLDIPVIE